MSTQESSNNASGGSRVGALTAVIAIVAVVAIGIAVVSQLETRRLRDELAAAKADVKKPDAKADATKPDAQKPVEPAEDEDVSSSGSGAAPAKPATPTAPTEIPSSFVDTVLASYTIVAPARIVPAKEKGQPIGFKVFSIQPLSVYEKIGLENGDVVLRVNDMAITDEASARAAQEKLRGVKKINIDVKRVGQPMRFTYNVTDDAAAKPK